MRRHLASWVLAIIGVLGASRISEAHFLFLRITGHAEAGRSAEVFFSEYATAGDPRFVAKIAATELWLQETPGTFRPLEVHTTPDRLRAVLPAGKPLAVVGRCQYGVLKRDRAFLLRYYPKAISGAASDWASFTPHGQIPLEITARVVDDRVQFTLLQQGKPVPEAKFTTIDADLTNVELTADAQGVASWQPPSDGLFSVYARHVANESGTLDGQAYDEIRSFATLSFDWPPAATKPQPEAVSLFERAIAARANWTKFTGFSAKVSGALDSRPFDGAVTVKADGTLQLDLEDDSARAWVEDQLSSLVTHRQANPNRAPPVVRFADADVVHPLGRLVNFHGGRFASSYRIRDDEITVVNRHLGSENMSITMLENERTAEGKILPRSYSVQYWDAASGKLNRVETFHNGWVRVAGLDLPRTLTVGVSSAAGYSVRSLTLREHQVLQ